MFSVLISPRLRQYVVILFVNLSVLTTGMSMGWPSPMIVKLRNATETPLYRPITEEEGSWIVSVGFFCCVFMNLPLGMLLDCIGRKYCLILICVPKIIVSILFIFATDVWMLILGRALIGVGDCFLVSVVPVYASEIATKDMRGILGTFQQLFSSLGIVISLTVGPYTSYSTFSIVFAAIILITSMPLPFLPDSPYFLYSKGKTNKAMEVLTLLRGTDQAAKEEIAVYATSMNNEKVDKMKLFKNRLVLKSLGISIVFCAGSQLVGFNAVSFYLQTILISTKTNVMPEIASVIMGLIQLFASCCATLATKRFNRKYILISSLTGMMIGMVGLGVFFKIKENTQEVSGFMNYLPLISLILVIYCYSAGMGSILWVLIAELFEGPARAVGVTISVIVTMFFVFLTTKYFAALTLVLGPATTYWLFSGACAFVCLFIYYCVPETKGKSFSEIQEALGDREMNDDGKEGFS